MTPVNLGGHYLSLMFVLIGVCFAVMLYYVLNHRESWSTDYHIDALSTPARRIV